MNYRTAEKLRKEIVHLVYKWSFETGSFILSSGKTSSFYIDGKKVTLSAEGINKISRYILYRIKEGGIAADAVGGLELGAVPIAVAVSAMSYLPEFNIPVFSFIVRKKPKGHGKKARVEGPDLFPGTRVVIVEDVVTTGQSALDAVNVVREQGCKVEKIFALVDREEGGRENIKEAGYTLESILYKSELDRLEEHMYRKYQNFWKNLHAEGSKDYWENLRQSLKELKTKELTIGLALQNLLTDVSLADNEENIKSVKADLAALLKEAEFGGSLTRINNLIQRISRFFD